MENVIQLHLDMKSFRIHLLFPTSTFYLYSSQGSDFIPLLGFQGCINKPSFIGMKYLNSRFKADRRLISFCYPYDLSICHREPGLILKCFPFPTI